MKVTKSIIGATIGAVAGGAAGYFIGREVEKREQANTEIEPAITFEDLPLDGEESTEEASADSADLETVEE